MPAMSDNPNRWPESELKQVPLPEGLIARLKQIAAGSDHDVDTALSNVPLPDGLLARLKATSQDEALDRALADVKLPKGLLIRLRNTPSRRVSPIRWAVAATLFIAIGLSYLTAMTGVIYSVYHRGAIADAPALDGQQPLALEQVPLAIIETLPAASEPDLAPPSPVAGPEIFALNDPYAASVERGPVGELLDLFALIPSGRFDPVRDVFLHNRELAVAQIADELPELETVEGASPRGIAPPAVKQFDWVRWIKDGVHPFVSPDAHPDLKQSHVPLVTSTGSYRAVLDALGEGRLPGPEEIRTEDFLAAIDYGFPLPTQRALGIRTAAGPSPFGDSGMSLLLVGVQAGAPPRHAANGRHLTLAVDVSASMARAGRLDQVRRAVVDFASQLGPRDRLSLVTFGQYADVPIEDAGPQDLASIESVIESIVPQQGTNLVAGLEMAAAASIGAKVDWAISKRMVLLTDIPGEVPPQAALRLEKLLDQAALHGTMLEVIRVEAGESPASALENLARDGGGRVRQASGAEAIRYALLEILTGQPQLVASGARLSISFNPKVVDRYRLLGHEADTGGGLVGGPIEANLRAGQTAVGLYELNLKPAGGDDVGWAELTWYDPADGRSQRLRQRISRLQFATSLLESPLSVQRAALAAETAEILRGSTFAPSHASGLARVLEVAQELNPRAREDRSLAQLITVAESAQRVRSGKPVRPGAMLLWPLRAPPR